MNIEYYTYYWALWYVLLEYFFYWSIITVKWNGVVGLRVLPTNSFSVKENSSCTYFNEECLMVRFWRYIILWVVCWSNHLFCPCNFIQVLAYLIYIFFALVTYFYFGFKNYFILKACNNWHRFIFNSLCFRQHWKIVNKHNEMFKTISLR